VALAAVVLIESCGRHIAFVCENVAARNVPSAQAESDTDGAPNDRYRAAADENAGVLARPGRPRRRRLRRPLLDTAVIAGWLTQSELAKPGTAERNERRGWRWLGQQSRLSKRLGRLGVNGARSPSTGADLAASRRRGFVDMGVSQRSGLVSSRRDTMR